MPHFAFSTKTGGIFSILEFASMSEAQTDVAAVSAELNNPITVQEITEEVLSVSSLKPKNGGI